MGKALASLTTISLLITVDRLLKLSVLKLLLPGESRALIPNVVHITRVDNTGAAFGILTGRTGFLAAFSLVCVGALIWLLGRRLSRKETTGKPGRFIKDFRSLGLSFIVAGAVGNLYDRLHYGFVVDFIDFRFWPVFNVADSAICAGVFLLFAEFFKSGRAPEKP